MGKAIWIGILGIIALGAILFMFTKTEPQPVVENKTENITIENVSLEDKAEFGDLVTVNYVLWYENGTVADTNNEELAKEAGLQNYVKGPVTFILGQSGKILNFDKAITGMKEGESRETILEPTEKEFFLRVNKTKSVNRFVAINRYQKFSVKKFKDLFKKPPIQQDVVYNEQFPWKYQVLNSTNETVLAHIYLKEGEEVVLPSTEWKSKTFQVYKDVITFYHMPEENQTIETEYGPAVINMTKSRMYLNYQPKLNEVFAKFVKVGGGFSMNEQFQVVEISDKDFVIKRIGVMADKRLKLNLDLLNLIKGVKEVDDDEPFVIKEVVGAPAS